MLGAGAAKLLRRSFTSIAFDLVELLTISPSISSQFFSSPLVKLFNVVSSVCVYEKVT